MKTVFVDLGSSLIHRTEMGCFAFGQGGLIHQTLATLNTNRVVTYTRWIDSVLSRDGLLIVSIHITDSLGRDEVVGGGAYAIALAQGELHAPSVGTNAGWNKQAQTTMNLLTGGNQPVRQLYQLTASATEQLPTAPFIAPIPPEDLTVADQPLTTDGAAYQSFPGNASAEVTPVASASSYNHPPPTATIYNLTVNGNGQPLSQLQPYAPTFCVGQNLTFSSSLPSLPPGFKAMTGIQWKLEGTYVNAATNAVPGKTFPDCSINYYFDPNPNLLTNSTVQGWWTSGSAPELYRVSVNCTLVFTNGTTASAQSGDFYFGMQRPRLVNYSKANPTIDVYLIHSHLYGTAPITQPVPFGGDSLATIQAQYNISVDSPNYNGKVIITQLGKAVATNQVFRFIDTHASSWLDNRVVYVGHDVLAGQATNSTIAFNDPPKIWCSGITKYNASFTDYIQFRPGTDPEATNNGNLFVTLGTVTWNTYSQTAPATNNGVIDFNPRRTNIPDITQSIDGFGQAQMDNTFTPSDLFPTWNRVIFNSTTNY